jgi:amidophosphoribosyltransferase
MDLKKVDKNASIYRAWDLDKPKEACGVYGIAGHPEAAKMTYLGLYALQHRGQESAGIASSDGDVITTIRRMGLVADAFQENEFEKLRGHQAIGHVRYSTSGSSTLSNAQPISVDYARGGLTVAHNGNLTNAEILRSELEAYGSIFSSTTDSEVVVHLIARSKGRRFVDTVISSLKKVEGAYSMLIMNEKQLIGVRDPSGFRPLVLGRLGESYILASETCALDIVDAQYIRDVEPGEMIVIDKFGVTSLKPFPEQRHALCVFEYIYFARPDSTIFGVQTDKVRREMGRQLARESTPKDADIVIPVPDSGVTAAVGFAQQAGLPFEMGLIRNHYVGRTFIEPSQTIRDFGVKIKLNPVRQVMKDRSVVVVDDSLVRGTTSRKIIKMLRKAGAREVHFRLSSPPVISPCFYGMDFPTRSELIANNMELEEIRRYLNVDSLAFLSIDGMMKAVNMPEEEFCKACFDANYPVGLKNGLQERDKLAMEGSIKCE